MYLGFPVESISCCGPLPHSALWEGKKEKVLGALIGDPVALGMVWIRAPQIWEPRQGRPGQEWAEPYACWIVRAESVPVGSAAPCHQLCLSLWGSLYCPGMASDSPTTQPALATSPHRATGAPSQSILKTRLRARDLHPHFAGGKKNDTQRGYITGPRSPSFTWTQNQESSMIRRQACLCSTQGWLLTGSPRGATPNIPPQEALETLQSPGLASDHKQGRVLHPGLGLTFQAPLFQARLLWAETRKAKQVVLEGSLGITLGVLRPPPHPRRPPFASHLPPSLLLPRQAAQLTLISTY